VWVLSGRSGEGLLAQGRRLQEWLLTRPELDPVDVGWSLISTRARLEHRAVLVGTDRDELMTRLQGLIDSEPGMLTGPGVVSGLGVVSGVGGGAGKTVLVFPGQGAQWLGMGARLLQESVVFEQKVLECADAFAPLVEWSLLDVLQGTADPMLLDRVDVVQPALFAVMVSLAEVWRSFGVIPDAVLGHSQGEIAAACVAGALSLEDAARVVVLRSRALRELSGQGGMASVLSPVALVEQRLTDMPGLAVAAVNGPTTTVVSGPTEQLDQFVAVCESDGVQVRRIAVNYASHSPQVDSLRQRLLEELATITARPSRIAFYSTVTGTLLDTTELDAGYWFRNLRETVDFAATVQTLLSQGHTVFVETSPHPVLTLGIEELGEQTNPRARSVVVTGSLRRDDGGLDRLLSSLAVVDVSGVGVDWTPVFDGRSASR
ncbi:acyltransferase domain-containing protein, partial [Nocardia noduli]|uniref:acyltransferase domain-containing protein n=1 Tax=Nocardia noduli TaxID=2815722 RepID=UPI001C21DC59